MSIEFLETDFDKVSYLVNLLTARATNMGADSTEFEALRYELLSNQNLAPHLPSWLKQHRNLDSFWGFIKPKFDFSFPSSGLGMPTFKLCLMFNRDEYELVLFINTPSGAWQ